VKVTTLRLNSFNSLAVGARRYFLLQSDARLMIVASECPHRGGPLNLGRRTACSSKLVCPWHNNIYPIHSIERNALPAIRYGEYVSFVTENKEIRVWTEMLPMNLHQAAHGRGQ
jgi:nitrite reductase/ring-hydroxylating ferredoxin subunit